MYLLKKICVCIVILKILRNRLEILVYVHNKFVITN